MKGEGWGEEGEGGGEGGSKGSAQTGALLRNNCTVHYVLCMSLCIQLLPTLNSPIDQAY